MANFNIDYLVVAGGGAGGVIGGGGGAGGFRTSYGTGNINGGLTPVETSQSLSTGDSYQVTVGSGGVATPTPGNSGPDGQSGSGGDSSFAGATTILSTGGGGGGNYDYGPGASGGSGGGGCSRNAYRAGGSRVTIPVQGFNGSSNNSSQPYPSGGGGGAGGAGGIATGGSALSSSITGTPTLMAGGGGGGWQSYYGGSVNTTGGGGGASNGEASNNASSATANTGSGGGGGGFSTNLYYGQGGNGGSGIVILRYATADVISYTATGLTPTETTDGTDTILSFTTVGTGSITFTPPPPTPTFDGTKVTTPVTSFQSAVDVGLKIPIGTNSNLPTGVEGMIRNDTEENGGGTNSTTAITFYNGSDWKYFTSTKSPDSSPIENFNTVLYTGSTSPHAITGVGFQPDLIWIKNRDQPDSYAIVDSVRGIVSPAPYLASDLTDQQFTSTNMPTSVQSDGFTITGNGGRTNTSGEDYVAWCFKAGGAAVSNTDGSITSQVSVNNDLGFSIVKTTGTSGTINFGHGLDTAPEMIINKGLTSNGWSWLVYHKDIGTGKYLKLNSTDTVTTNANSFSSVTSTTITNNSSNSSSDYINYCFTSKPSFSKVGSYVGNGTTGNNKVDTGFEPAFVMIKSPTYGTASWLIIDNKRVESNGNLSELFADTSSAESGSGYDIDFNVDGFTLNTTTNNANRNNEPYIYLAFAT